MEPGWWLWGWWEVVGGLERWVEDKSWRWRGEKGETVGRVRGGVLARKACRGFPYLVMKVHCSLLGRCLLEDVCFGFVLCFRYKRMWRLEYGCELAKLGSKSWIRESVGGWKWPHFNWYYIFHEFYLGLFCLLNDTEIITFVNNQLQKQLLSTHAWTLKSCTYLPLT